MKVALYEAGDLVLTRAVIGQFVNQEGGVSVTHCNGLGLEDVREVVQEVTLPDAGYSAVLLVLSGKRGGEDQYVVRSLVHGGVNIPIIAITGSSSVDERVRLLNAGALHAFSAPVAGNELEAILLATLRLAAQNKNAVIEAGDLVVNVARSVAYSRATQEHLQLTGKERRLLEVLAGSKGRTLSKEAILTQLYTNGLEDEPEIKIIDVFICKLRKKISALLGDPSIGARIIATVWGRGYRFQDPESETAAA